jgi:GNAT superfamily N-acetyltransferase
VDDEVVIRPARRGDGNALAGPWIEFGRYYADRDPVRFRVPAAEGLAEWFEGRIEQVHALWLVAERSGTVIAFVEAQVWPGADDADYQLMREVAEPVLKVNSLFVDKAECGRGIGKALMEAAEAWGKERGATSAAVVAIADSPSAVPFYVNGMGYESNTIGFWKLL